MPDSKRPPLLALRVRTALEAVRAALSTLVSSREAKSPGEGTGDERGAGTGGAVG